MGGKKEEEEEESETEKLLSFKRVGGTLSPLTTKEEKEKGKK